MARTTHDRTLDHRGTELDTDVVLDGALAAPVSTASASTVHQALVDINAEFRDGGVQFVFGGGTSAITTGIKLDVEMPFAGTILANRLVADQTGSIVIDIWKGTYADALAGTIVDADSITSSTPPTISSALASQDTTLTSWTVAFADGDWFRFNVDSVTNITRVTLALRIRRT